MAFAAEIPCSAQSLACVGAQLKTTPTVRLLFNVRVHVLVDTLSQPAAQPPKAEAPFGVAVSVTEVPVAKARLHVEVQLMPVGELITVPVPVPAKVTVRTGNVPPVKPGHPSTATLFTVTVI